MRDEDQLPSGGGDDRRGGASPSFSSIYIGFSGTCNINSLNCMLI